MSDSFCLLIFSSLPRVNFQNIPGRSLLLLNFLLISLFFFLAGVGKGESLESINQRTEVVLCPRMKAGEREHFASFLLGCVSSV